MSRAVNRVSILGLFLIAAGLVILMKKFHVITFRTSELIWPLFALMGLFVTGRGLADHRKGKIVGGTVIFLYSIFFFVRSMDSFYVPIDLIVPATFLIFGIVFLMLFVNRPGDWYFLVPGIVLMAVGTSIMLTEYGYWYGWEVRYYLKTWWPAALVLLGLGMILKRRGQKPSGIAGAHGTGEASGGDAPVTDPDVGMTGGLPGEGTGSPGGSGDAAPPPDPAS